MDVINVVSVTSMAQVNHLNEDKDDDVQSALYWRQALDVRSMELSVSFLPPPLSTRQTSFLDHAMLTSSPSPPPVNRNRMRLQPTCESG